MAFVLGEIFEVFHIKFIWFLIVIFIFLVVLHYYKKDYFWFVIIFSFFFLSGGFLLSDRTDALKIDKSIPDADEVIIEGQASEVTDKNGRYFCYIYDANIISSSHRNITKYHKVIVYFENDVNIKFANKVRITGTYKEFSKARNPGNYDEENYYHSLGTACKFYVKEYEITDDRYDIIIDGLFKIKKALRDSLYAVCSEKDASVFSAMLLGDRNIDGSINDLYKANGIAHILSISGLHISVIGIGAYKLFRRKFLFTSSALFSAAVMIGYGIITGGAVSIIRAIVMFLIKIMADVIGRSYDMATGTAIAAFVILVFNPLYILNTAFLLSFLAILAITVFSPITEKYFMLAHNISKALNISVLITIITMPVILNTYYQTPLYSPLINLIIIPLSGILLISGLAGAALGVIAVQGGSFIIGIGCFVLRFYEGVCNVFSSLPYSTITSGKLSLPRAGIYCGLVFILLAIMHLINKYKLDDNFWRVRYGKRCICIVFLILIVIILFFKPQNDLEITMIDVGQGESILIQVPGGQILCIDSGSTDISGVEKYRILPTLKSKGISRIDYFFVTHSDSDHVNGLIELLENYRSYNLKIRNIVLWSGITEDDNLKDIIRLADSCDIGIKYIAAGIEMFHGPLNVKCLHPDDGYHPEDANESSLVLSLEYQEFSMLFTGDIDSAVEESLISSHFLRDYDIIKVAHHGSKTAASMDFLKAIKPEYAVISCGVGNVYGHPHEETINMLEELKIKIYVTNADGAIQIKSDGNTYDVSKFIKK